MAEDLLPAHPKPRRFSLRGLVIALVSLVVFAVMYGLVVREYQVDGVLSTQDSTLGQDADVSVVAEPVDFDARTNTMSVRFRIEVLNTDLLDQGVRLNQGLRFIVSGADGSHEFRFAKGEPVGNVEVDLGTSGEVYAYPFDTHEGFIAVATETFDRGAGGINETTGELMTSLAVAGSVSGWGIDVEISDMEGFPIATVDLARAFSTKIFAVVLLTMAISVVVLAFISATLTVTNRRRFEVALLTWNGAILFALPLLRNYLPGSPPIGAGIDIYIYLWVFVFAVISLILMLISWSQQRKSELLEEQAKLGGH